MSSVFLMGMGKENVVEEQNRHHIGTIIPSTAT
jgi:hypothetical protein